MLHQCTANSTLNKKSCVSPRVQGNNAIWLRDPVTSQHKDCLLEDQAENASLEMPTFGCIPLNPISIYQGPTKVWHSIPSVLQAHKMIRDTGIPNFGGYIFLSIST